MTPSPASDVSVSDAHRRAGIAAHAADDKKGEEIVVLDVGDIISITDYFVIASAGNTRQVRTIVDTIEEQLRELADAPQIRWETPELVPSN